MDQGEDIMMQTAAELRRHIRIVRVLTSALLRLLKPRRRLEDRRNGAQQNPVLDQAQNPDRAARWAANEQEVARLQARNTALAAGVDAAQRDVDGLQAQVDALQAQAGQGVGPASQPMSRADELSMLTDEVRNQVAADPELSAQLAGLSQDEQNLVHGAVAGDMQVRLHGEEMVRRPDGSLMTRNEELQSITDDVRTRVADDPELAAQLAGLSPEEQDLAQRHAALGIQQELDRRFPDSRDPNLDQDHDLVPDDIGRRREGQDLARQREAQDEEYRQYVDPDGDGVDNAAGTAAAVDELDDRAEDLDEPETDQARQPELNEPDAEQVRLQEGLDGADPEQVRQQEGLDGADPEQVQGARGPEVGQDGQGVGRDGASESVVGGHQQPGQDQQGASADQSGPQGVNIGSMHNGAFAVGANARAEVHFHGPGQDQPGVDQPGVDQPDGPGRQGQRTDALEDTLAQARADKGQGTVRVGSVSNSNINGLEIGDQGLPAGEYSEGERGGFDFKTTTPGGQEVRMHFEEGATVGGKKVTAEEIAKLQRHQAGSPPAGSPRPEAQTAESADAGQGARPDHALRAARPDRGGRGQEGSGPKPEGRG